MILFAVIEHTTGGYCDSCENCQASFFGVFTTKEKAEAIAKQNNMDSSDVIEFILDEPIRDVAIY